MTKHSMTTTKLEMAKEKIQEAIELLKLARDENKTLRGYYNIDEDIINELERVNTNPKGFQGNFVSIEDILDNYGDTWFNIEDQEYDGGFFR